jgi:hypothetical protein
VASRGRPTHLSSLFATSWRSGTAETKKKLGTLQAVPTPQIKTLAEMVVEIEIELKHDGT